MTKLACGMETGAAAQAASPSNSPMAGPLRRYREADDVLMSPPAARTLGWREAISNGCGRRLIGIEHSYCEAYGCVPDRMTLRVCRYRIENGYAPSALETELRGDRFALIN